MMRSFCLVLCLFLRGTGFCQTSGLDTIPRKGSYLYYGQPAFEDNSFLLKEAINQERGVMQYVTNFYFDNIKTGEFLYSFNQEIPISHLRHQIEYTIFYHVQNTGAGNGFGDLNIGYRYALSGKKAWAMVVPGFTLILPTGKAAAGTGTGGIGARVNLAVTKRLSRKLVSHYNADFTFISKADRYNSNISGGKVLSFERDLNYSSVGASLIWYQKRKFNWMLENVYYYLSDIKSDGTLTHSNQVTVNPGLRLAIDHRLVQIVPGISAPLIFVDGKYDRAGLFFYLSFEPEYLPFTKSKTR
jgi:hypothetical protein